MNLQISRPAQPSMCRRLFLLPLLLGASLALALLPAAAQQTPGVLPPLSKPYGKTYGQWSAAWWQWAMSHPIAGHPMIDDPSFNVASGQSGQVWFIGAPFGTIERHVTIPPGTALFVALLNAEASNLEGLGATAAEQRDTANFLANHITSVACSIDGVAVGNLANYRVTSAQFGFTAPTPWIFGAEGGEGTSVADGYFVMLAPLSVGTHTLKVQGGFHFAVAEGDPFDFDASADLTYHITVR